MYVVVVVLFRIQTRSGLGFAFIDYQVRRDLTAIVVYQLPSWVVVRYPKERYTWFDSDSTIRVEFHVLGKYYYYQKWPPPPPRRRPPLRSWRLQQDVQHRQQQQLLLAALKLLLVVVVEYGMVVVAIHRILPYNRVHQCQLVWICSQQNYDVYGEDDGDEDDLCRLNRLCGGAVDVAAHRRDPACVRLTGRVSLKSIMVKYHCVRLTDEVSL